jgi:excisionase family DNA binding protein
VAELSVRDPNDLPVVLRAADVQQVLRLSKLKTYELLNQEGFPLVKIGRAYRVPRDAFFRWLAAQVEPDEAR